MLLLAFIKFHTIGQGSLSWRQRVSCTLHSTLHSLIMTVCQLRYLRCKTYCPGAGLGVLLFTEAHLEYNAGLVIPIGNRNKHSPLEHDTSAQTLARSLQAGRLALVSRARSPVNPSDTVMSCTLFTPFVGTAMQSARPLCGLVLVRPLHV